MYFAVAVLRVNIFEFASEHNISLKEIQLKLKVVFPQKIFLNVKMLVKNERHFFKDNIVDIYKSI